MDTATHLASVALAHERAQGLLRQAELRATQLARFYAASNAVNESMVRSRDLTEIYGHACRLVVQHGLCRFAWVGAPSGPGHTLECLARTGNDAGLIAAVTGAGSGGHPERACIDQVLSGGGHHVSNSQMMVATGAQATGAQRLRSRAIFPLTQGGYTVGIFALYSDVADVYAAEALNVLDALAADISVAIDAAYAERERQRLTRQLSERVKELTLLHRAARLLESRLPFDQLFGELVQHIPTAWQHPSRCEARISFCDVDVRTPGFEPTLWMLSAAFGDASRPGRIEVAYRPADAAAAAHAFLPEEMELLGSIANMLSVNLSQRGFEEALQRSEQRLRSVIEHTPNVTIQWYDRDGRIVHCNKASERLFGNSLEVLRGKTLTELNFSPDEVERFHEAIEAVATSGEAFGPSEFRFQQRDGVAGVLLSTLFELPALDGERCFACMDIDLTEHRRMQQTARSEEHLRELIYKSVVDVLYCLAVEPDGFRFLAVNPAFSAATLRDEKSVVGKLVQDVFPASTLTLTLAKFAESMAERKPISWEQMWTIGSAYRHGEVTVTPVFDADGRCTNLVGTVRDITSRRHAEQARKRLDQQLHHSQRLQALGTLTGGIAHDFNNVLAAIGGNVELGLGGLLPSDPAEGCFVGIRKATNRATELVRQILSFSRQDVPSRHTLDVSEIMGEVAGMLRATFPASVQFEVQLEEGTPRISGNAGQLHQVLMNLGTNAALALTGRQGSVRFGAGRFVAGSVAGASGPPELAAGGSYAQLTVSDDGCGMDEPTQTRMFEPFFSTRPVGVGTGLGLSVVHGIVHNHDGAIAATSQLGQGTTFQLYFPAVEVSAEAEVEAESVEVPRPDAHVLFIDDEEALVFLASRLLPRAGYRVTGYSNPAQALSDFRARPGEFDVIVTDFSMPVLAGPDLVRELRRVRPEIPVIMTSGYIRPEDITSAERLGVGEIFLKPHSTSELCRVIQQRLAAAMPPRQSLAPAQLNVA
jgi:PAS domain S-box-containing protein